MSLKPLELLSPAKNRDIAIQAILHGADAVYIGASSHGARRTASNSLQDIEELVDFAHQYRSKVYATVNTIVYDNEIKKVESLCRDLYHIGIDALIIQDMGILRMNIPPVQLHASTQCDIRTPEKARFLERVGFSQIVLARELGLKEIKLITDAVTIPVECFVHGALCVSYSGRCNISCHATGRSANRGECAQICRLPFELTDNTGKKINTKPYLLSLKDLNQSANLKELIDVGVSSFKIEGRLKDEDYVKNITYLYHSKLNEIIAEYPSKYTRSSFGRVITSFTGVADKSFNRGFTDYFLLSRKPRNISSSDTPKSKGERIEDINQLQNGDGISFFDLSGNYQGVNVNKVENGKIFTRSGSLSLRNTEIFRTYDNIWQKNLSSARTERKIALSLEIDESGVRAYDERGMMVKIPLEFPLVKADKPQSYESEFCKFGNTFFYVSNYKNILDNLYFIPKSAIGNLRRRLVQLLENVNNGTYPFSYRKKEDLEAIYPASDLIFSDNVSNKLSEDFYKSHGVVNIEPAMEIGKIISRKGLVLMTTRHCILRELGMCKKDKKISPFKEPLTISSGNYKFNLKFNCKDCEMQVLSSMFLSIGKPCK